MAEKLKNKVFEDVEIRFRNFSGNEGQYNRAGDRNFCMLLEPDVAAAMIVEGFNVKYLKPREEDEDVQQAYIKIKINFRGRPPRIRMITSRGQTDLGEGEINILDWANIEKTDLIISPYEWDVNGNQGITAYLQSIAVTIEEDALDLKYAEVPDSAQNSMVRDYQEPGDDGPSFR